MNLHCGYITKLKNVRKHPNADRLQLADVFMTTVVVGLEAKEGDIVLYFPTDLQLSKEYAEKNNLVRKKDENGKNIGGFLDPDKRNIKAINLRGEKSDGLVVGLETLKDFTDINKLKVGDTISTVGGHLICEKYIPRNNRSASHSSRQLGKKGRRNSHLETINFPDFKQHSSTAQLQYNLNEFKEGDLCYITLKLHGTSGRTGHLPKHYKPKTNLLQRLFRRSLKKKVTYDYITGSRRVDLVDIDKKDGFYGSNEFRKEWHDFFKGKLHKGETVYYEIVGFVDKNKPVMADCNNKKLNDKEFIKKYGDTTRFTYGCEDGENDIYVYRITITTPNGYVVELPWELVKLRCEQMGVKYAPEFDKFLFTTQDDLIKRVEEFESGADPIGKTHIREGVVIRLDGRKDFTALKHKNFEFKVLEGIIKESATEPDIEEEQELN